MPVERTVDRLKRILVLVPWVISKGGATVDEICERFGMGRRELLADLDLLMVCGLPPFMPDSLIEVFVDDDRVVIGMGADAIARPPRLTRSEALSLLVTGRAVAGMPGVEESSSLHRALEKLARAVVPGDAEQANALADRIAVSLSSAGADMVAALRESITERARLAIDYYSAGRGEMSAREIDPLIVFGKDGYWYVAAFDHASGEVRTFRADRIKDARPTGERFEPYAFDADAFVDGPLFTPSEGDIEAVVDVAPSASWIREVVPYEHATEGTDGWIRVTLRTAHLAWLVRLLLSAGDGARVVAPDELREAVRATARRALAAYAS